MKTKTAVKDNKKSTKKVSDKNSMQKNPVVVQTLPVQIQKRRPLIVYPK